MSDKVFVRINWKSICLASVTVMLAISGAAQQAPKATNAVGERLVQDVGSLRGIVIAPRYEDVSGSGVTNVTGVVVRGPDFLKTQGFEQMLKRFLGAPLTQRALTNIQHEIRLYCQDHDHLIVDVITPEQEIANQTVQVVVIEGRVSQVTLSHQGRAWFSDSIIRSDVPFKTNGAILESRLDNGLNLANNNTYQSLNVDQFGGSFREVTASFSRGRDPGQTDVNLQAQERFPLRVFGGYDDFGIKVIGEDQLYGGFNWANVFGLDQRVNYQYVTDTSFEKLREHLATYAIPLPWGHQLTFFGAYANVNPDFAVISPTLAGLSQKGIYEQASARYAIPLPSLRSYVHSLSAGFDFKRTDTPLLFGPGSIKSNKVDVNQFTLSYDGTLKDDWGSTTFSLQGVYSPGGAIETQFANNSAYNSFRTGAKVEYAYGRGEIKRETLLPLSLPGSFAPGNFTWFLRGVGQYSDARLLPTEEFGLGGYDTVRGYDERVVEGDNGWLLVNELRSPRILLGNLTTRANAHDWFQGLVFCDYGRAINRQPNAASLESSGETLLSVGVGFRYEIADNVRFRIDYGFQLDRRYATSAANAGQLGPQPKQRANLGLELSF